MDCSPMMRMTAQKHCLYFQSIDKQNLPPPAPRNKDFEANPNHHLGPSQRLPMRMRVHHTEPHQLKAANQKAPALEVQMMGSLRSPYSHTNTSHGTPDPRSNPSTFRESLHHRHRQYRHIQKHRHTNLNLSMPMNPLHPNQMDSIPMQQTEERRASLYSPPKTLH